MLLRGEAGWGEWSPFLEYDADGRRAVAALRRGGGGRRLARPGPRGRAGQRHGARGRPGAGAQDRARGRLRDGQGEGGRAGPVAGRRPGAGGGGARRAGPVGPGARRRQRRVVGRRRGDRDRPAGQGRRRAGVRRAALRDGRGAGGGAPCGRRTDRGGRVDPAGLRPLPGPRPRGRRHRGAQGAAARRGARLPADRGGDRAAGRRVVGARDLGRDRGRPRAGGGAAVAALRVRPGHRAAADGGRGGRAAGAGRRGAAGTAADRRPARARPAGGHRRPGRALGGPAGRGAGPDDARHRAGPFRRLRADRGRRPRGGAGTGFAERAARPSRRTTPPRPGCSGCTPGSTSGPRASWRWD